MKWTEDVSTSLKCLSQSSTCSMSASAELHFTAQINDPHLWLMSVWRVEPWGISLPSSSSSPFRHETDAHMRTAASHHITFREETPAGGHADAKSASLEVRNNKKKRQKSLLAAWRKEKAATAQHLLVMRGVRDRCQSQKGTFKPLDSIFANSRGQHMNNSPLPGEQMKRKLGSCKDSLVKLFQRSQKGEDSERDWVVFSKDWEQNAVPNFVRNRGWILVKISVA